MKKLLTLVIIVLSVVLLYCLAVLFEPNNVYTAEGYISKIRTSSGVKTMCDVWKGAICEADNKECKKYENKDCNKYRYTKGFEITYYDQHGEQTVDLNPEEETTWGPLRLADLPASLQASNLRKVHTGPRINECYGTPYLGCRVKLYYLRGAWFDDQSWYDPIVDASMCRSPQKLRTVSKKPQKAEKDIK